MMPQSLLGRSMTSPGLQQCHRGLNSAVCSVGPSSRLSSPVTGPLKTPLLAGQKLHQCPLLGPTQADRCQRHQTQALPAVIASIAASPYRDYVCLAGAVGGAVAWVKIFNWLASEGYMDKKLSRKLVHATSGPLFVLTWPLFSADPSARFIAAIVPFLNMMRLFLVGSGAVSDPGLVASVSRSGDRGELLRGPLYYCVVLILAALTCWRSNPTGLMVVSLMCGGDGMADIVGRRWGSAKLPYNKDKSWAGSAAMLGAGALMSVGFITLFSSLGFFEPYPPEVLVGYVLVVCTVATFMESLPINHVFDDNLSVPLVSYALGLALLP